MILADTSVWVEHLNGRATILPSALEEQSVLVHQFVVGELACGMFPSRAQTLLWLKELPAAPVASDAEVLELIEHRRLMGSGIGYIDAHLIASVLLTESGQLHTNDKRLAAVAAKLGVAYKPVR